MSKPSAITSGSAQPRIVIMPTVKTITFADWYRGRRERKEEWEETSNRQVREIHWLKDKFLGVPVVGPWFKQRSYAWGSKAVALSWFDNVNCGGRGHNWRIDTITLVWHELQLLANGWCRRLAVKEGKRGLKGSQILIVFAGATVWTIGLSV
jgi:hypothetical protein